MKCCQNICCLCCSSMCCNGKFKQSTYYLKVVQITFIILDIIATETTFIYLGSIEVTWRTDGFPAFDIHRAILWTSLISTAVLLYLFVRKNKRKSNEKLSNLCMVCDGVEQAYFENLRIRKPIKKWNLDFGDFLHSLTLATSFMLCAVFMLSDIPKTYESHIQVDMKLISFVTDMVLGLIYTKSSTMAYSRYEGPSPCTCAVNPTWGRPNKKKVSLTPTDGDEEIEIYKNQPMTKTSNGKIYSKIGS